MGKILTGYYTMWVKKEEAPVIHYLKFVLDLKLKNSFEKKVIAYKITRVEAKQAIFKVKQLKNTS